MMIHVYNPSAQRLRQEDSNFEAALGNTVRLFHNKTNPDHFNTRQVSLGISKP